MSCRVNVQAEALSRSARFRLGALASRFKNLQDPSILQFVGLKVGLSGAQTGGLLEMDHPEVIMNQEFAALLGRMTLTLVGLRLCRALPLIRGWPRRCVMGLKPELAGDMLQAFRADAANVEAIKGSKVLVVKKVVERSIFRSLPVQHCLGVFQEANWESTPDVLDFLRRKHARLIGSILIEDGFCREHLAEKSGRNSTMACDRIGVSNFGMTRNSLRALRPCSD